MEREREADVIVIGAGPAGSAAAIQLARCRPARADRVLLLDAEVFPREKLCGGGLVREADRLLAHLGVRIDVPAVRVDRVRFEYAGGHAALPGARAFRVIHREEFDHALLREAQALGVCVREGEPAVSFERVEHGVRVATPRGSYRAPVVIGADGARSVVRRGLVGEARGERFVALEVLTPGDPADRTAVFDFGPVARGLRGYVWDFPSVRGGRPIVNRGIGGSRWPRDVSLRQLFAEALRARGVDLARRRLDGWSAPLYHPESRQSAPHVLLAGDAVGIDPWLGEGISVALGTGIVAAHAAHEALETGDFRFADHTSRVRDSAVGWNLCRRREIADPFYEAAGRTRGLEQWLAAGGAA